MKEIFKWICWALFLVSLLEIVDWQTMPKDVKHEAILKVSISSLNEKSRTLFFLGSSRIMKGVNPQLLNDSLPNWNTINLGMSGNSLAQNLFFAQFLSKQPGKKVLFIELTKFKTDMPLSFSSTGKILDIPNFPYSYYQYVNLNKGVKNKLENTEKVFWDWLIRKQTGIKSLLSGEVDESYKTIGFTPVYKSNYPFQDSFINRNDMVEFSHNDVDLETWERLQELLKLQKDGIFKLVFLMPLNYKTEDELALEIPIYKSLPFSSKWEYEDQFLKEITNSSHLEDRNHLNYRGAMIYSQGLVKYIKANEKNW
ncbi:hypothetical protein [Aquirufa aurantiipilula]|uniref:DUF1574 domain-containing protein n=1 Tax=Aquirufa aurantiipilula TaxID=2696561 RepID=A0ABT6BK62_9BACT|nr:hypothetical protein [Aquirufa aurantiipilula]MDF5690857.1 hypothetical protein [Aquirufa aurantiipilula]